MTDKLTTIHPPKYSNWPTEQLVQLRPAGASALGSYYDVLLAGEPVGKVETFTETPSRNISGTRLRQELKPRKVWRGLTGEANERVSGRLTYELRWEAVRDVLDRHLAK